MLAGHSLHLNFGVVDRVLLATGRDYSPDIASRTFTWKISFIHYDPGDSVHHSHRLRTKRPLQVSSSEVLWVIKWPST